MDFKTYSGFMYSKYLKFKISQQSMRDVSVDAVPRGIVVNEHLHGFGVFDENYRFVKSSKQIRRNNGQFIPKFNHDNIPYEDKEVFFWGNVYPHFGHFMLEHMNRAWVLRDKKYANMYVVLVNAMDVNPVPGYVYKFVELCGIPRDKIIILNKTTQFRNVFVPAQAFNIPVYSSNEFGWTFDMIANNIQDSGEVYEKVYVSRDAMGVRRTLGERKIQDIFAANGFHIIYPEQLPLEKQISIISRCKVLAGCAGTALHLALFMKSGGTVIQIKRNRRFKDNAALQYMINKTKKLNSVFIAGGIEKTAATHYGSVSHIIGLNKYMRQFFDDNNFVYDKNAPVVDANVWNEYITQLTQYNSEHGSEFSIRLRKLLIRISTLFVPGRERRNIWRQWLKKKMKLA